MEKQSSSNIGRDSIDQLERNTNTDPSFDSDIVDSPIVISLTTPYPQPSGSVRTTVHTLRKLQEQEREIKKQQRRIQELEFSIAIQNAHAQHQTG